MPLPAPTTWLRGLLPFLTLLLCACVPKPVTPIPVLSYHNPNLERPQKLFIMLRGIWGGEGIFAREGLVDEVFDRGLPFDVVAPAAHFGYYKAETLPQRLEQDIIAPARAKGYREIWLVGTSMGGLGALMYLTDHPRDVDGVILLGPFLGWGNVAEEIDAAGGIAAWQPGPVTVADWERYLWAWIKNYAAQPEPFPPIYLGYGRDDFFFAEQRALARVLPPDHSILVQGAHDYATLRVLWKAELDRLDPILRR